MNKIVSVECSYTILRPISSFGISTYMIDESSISSNRYYANSGSSQKPLADLPTYLRMRESGLKGLYDSWRKQGKRK